MRPLRRTTRAMTLALVPVLGAAGVAQVRFPHPPMPHLTGALERGSLVVDGRTRTFATYAPSPLPPKAALLIALHGSGETGTEFRWHTGYAFDRAADANGFLVVYPDGYQRHWDDCRKDAQFTARTLHIDDVAFVRALVAHLETKLGIDRARVFAAGHSNGGQMAYRLALEAPGQLRAVAAISASLPTPASSDCKPSGAPVPVLVMNGTDDPINPYAGGHVSLFGVGDRGDVVSSEATARSFAKLAGLDGPPLVERVSGGDGKLWVERSTWGAKASPEVVLDTVHGGGHVVPQKWSRYPEVLGKTDTDFDGPGEIWRFFASIAARTPR